MDNCGGMCATVKAAAEKMLMLVNSAHTGGRRVGGRLRFLTRGGQGLVYRRLETANVLDCRTVRLNSLHVLVEDGEDLIVEDLVLSDAVGHFLQGLKIKATY